MIPVKNYVDVKVQFKPSGEIVPLAILWPDGRQFDIDRILRIDNCAAVSGGSGRRYEIKIQGKKRGLFYANDYSHDGTLRWFVESDKCNERD